MWLMVSVHRKMYCVTVIITCLIMFLCCLDVGRRFFPILFGIMVYFNNVLRGVFYVSGIIIFKLRRTRQGSILSPIWFHIFLSDLLGELSNSQLGLHSRDSLYKPLVYTDISLLSLDCIDCGRSLCVRVSVVFRWFSHAEILGAILSNK